MPECYIRGSTIKYLRIPDEVIDMVKEEVVAKSRGRGGGMRGRGRGGRGGKIILIIITCRSVYRLYIDSHSRVTA